MEVWVCPQCTIALKCLICILASGNPKYCLRHAPVAAWACPALVRTSAEIRWSAAATVEGWIDTGRTTELPKVAASHTTGGFCHWTTSPVLWKVQWRQYEEYTEYKFYFVLVDFECNTSHIWIGWPDLAIYRKCTSQDLPQNVAQSNFHLHLTLVEKRIASVYYSSLIYTRPGRVGKGVEWPLPKIKQVLLSSYKRLSFSTWYIKFC